MKILITGARGQLGSQIVNIIKNGKSEIGSIPKEMIGAEIVGIDIQDLDLTDQNAVISFVKKENPDIIINPAAYTNVDACEANVDIAFKVNALAARNMAMAAEAAGAKLVHISTDYVFSGEGSSPIKEYDLPAPVSVYGKTKLAGENFVKEYCSKYFIVRTAWLYGYNGKNFVYTIMNAAKEKGHLDVVNDQRGNPTNAEDVAHHILKIAVSNEYGTYHCTGTGECSWFDFAKAIVEYAGIDCEVNPITSDKLVNRAAKRPAYSSLDNMMLRCTVGDEMRDWKEALKVFMKNVKNK
ncbi:dTDP-4-dehydrorhamnose reductase [Clostridium polynesiense]|uniref:dTDP-4-dehydrorhamnose reductase n=1 Tax=Clostridium polynesiense TaxID=1325933 RepID=UPI00058F5E09|nr:dTDP-4-dehydrorhamnose reductase [Clostridium polynesiense]